MRARGPADARAAWEQEIALIERQLGAPYHQLDKVPSAVGQVGAVRTQRSLIDGRFPWRRLVEGDQEYLAAIMEGTGLRPGQNKVYASTITRNVDHILLRQLLPDEAFPDGDYVIVVAADGRILEGHHRLIASVIARRLTGRPLFPWEGADAIIPEEEIAHLGRMPTDEHPQLTAEAIAAFRRSVREGPPWRRMGVLR